MKQGRRSFLLQGAGLAAAPWLSQSAWAATAMSSGQSQRALTVQAPCGAIRGGVVDGVRSFKGIAYGQAPVGELRFQAPRALAATAGVRNAFGFADAPLQPDRVQAGTGRHFIGDTPQGEDCLALNIWAPDTPGPHPVFVWVYGGSNVYGATSQPIYDGTSFARQGVVCVTIGYRLGAFGFLELGDILGEAWRGSGNNALRDQVLGLRWVRDNIAAFGGDPARVTLGGESAGGKNVSALLAVPEAEGLFARAIIESGGGMTTHTPEEAAKVTALMLDALRQVAGNAGGDARSLLLQSSPQVLLQAQTAAIARYGRNFAFRPVVDGHFLPHTPQQCVAAGASSKVPLLIGSNRDEALLFFPPALVAAHRKDPATDAPITARELAQLDVSRMTQAAERYRQAFPQQSAFARRVRLITAEEYWMPTVRLAEAHAAAGGLTYMYRFDEAARQEPFAGYVVHAAELSYTWRNFREPFLEMLYGRDPAVPPFADVVHQTWVSFIRDGQPRHAQLPAWTPYQPDRRATMLLDSSGSRMADDPAGQERALWDGLI